MNKEETRQILTVLRINYPQSYRDYDTQTSAMLLDIWADAFKDVPAKLVREAVTDIIKNDTREFAPNPGQVTNRILNRYGKDYQQKALDAWAVIKDYMHYMNWDTSDVDRYYALPEDIRRFYSYGALKDMAEGKARENDQFEKPKFLKMYEEMSVKNDQKLLAEGKILQVLGPEALALLEHEEDKEDE